MKYRKQSMNKLLMNISLTFSTQNLGARCSDEVWIREPLTSVAVLDGHKPYRWGHQGRYQKPRHTGWLFQIPRSLVDTGAYCLMLGKSTSLHHWYYSESSLKLKIFAPENGWLENDHFLPQGREWSDLSADYAHGPFALIRCNLVRACLGCVRWRVL